MQDIVVKIIGEWKNTTKKPWAIHHKAEQDKVNVDADWVRQKEGEERPDHKHRDSGDDRRGGEPNKLAIAR